MRIAVIIALGLVLLNLAVFLQVRNFDFVNYDDGAHVYNNLPIQRGLTGPGIEFAFTSTLVGNYIPITTLTYLLDFQFHGLDPGGFHLTNTLFHTLNVLLLFGFLCTATGRIWPSAFAAALFAVHPLHVESVAWISARKDVVSTFFWLMAMLSYAAYAKRPRVLPYLLTFLFFLLGLLSKPMLVTFPVILLLVDFWPLNRITLRSLGSKEGWPLTRRLLLEKLPFLAAVMVIGIVTSVIQYRAGAISSVSALPILDRVTNALWAYFAYIANMLWPAELIAHYPYRTGALSPLLALGAAALLIAITALFASMAARRPYLITGWLWYLVTLLPVIGLIQIGGQAMADRYTYVPLIGLFIAASWAAADLVQSHPKTRPFLVPAAVALTLILATVAWRQTGHWRNSTTLFSHVVQVDPDNVVGHSLLGKSFYDKHEFDLARKHLERALELRPTHKVALLNLGVVHAEEGRLDEAIECYGRILEVHPDDHSAHSNMGSALIRLKKADEAVTHLEAALREAPDAPDALINLGAARLMQGRPEDALEPLRRALEISPDDEVAHLNIALSFYELDAKEDASRHTLEAIRLKPDYIDAQEFLKLLKREGAAD